MDNPTECKWCGCGDIRAETDSAIHFRCFSSYWHEGDEWNIATNCAAKCAVQLVELRAKVQWALEALKNSTRYYLDRDAYGKYMRLGPQGMWMDAREVDQVIQILEGKSDATG